MRGMVAVVDLHAHLPMHLESVGEGDATASFFARIRELDYVEEHFLVMLGGFLFGNWYHGKPRVTLESLRAGGVDAVFSALYPFFDEIDGAKASGYAFDWELHWPAPKSGYFADVCAQMDAVDAAVMTFEGGAGAVVVRNYDELIEARQLGQLAVIHALEGGFALGATADEIESNVKSLADKGLAYVTIAHLLYRHIAANVPPLPNLVLRRGAAVDGWCEEHLPVPAVGLTPLGQTLVRAMVANGVLLDLTHLTERAMTETLDLLDQLDPSGLVPVLVSHGAYRFGQRQYNLTDAQVRRIARRRGLIGLLLCEDFMQDGLDVEGAVPVLVRHIQKLQEIIGAELPDADPFDYLGLGTDLDGFIHPLEGVNTAADLGALAEALHQTFGQRADKICRGSAYRLLQSGKLQGRRVGGRTPWAAVP